MGPNPLIPAASRKVPVSTAGQTLVAASKKNPLVITKEQSILPKVAKKPKIIPDEYGFSINPNLASAYRDIQLELRALVNRPTRKIPARA